jgi:hypothetical protein
LEALQNHLEKLCTGHEEVANKLQLKAKALAALPREMRDAIFEQLYIQDHPIEVKSSRIGDNVVFQMPKDKALYLSKWHVGPQVASEAAIIFYKYNTFVFNSEIGCSYGRGRIDITAEKLEQWLDTDHFASGMTPRGMVRKIKIHLRGGNHYFLNTTTWDGTTPKIPGHAKFESQVDENRIVHNEFDQRGQLDYLSKIEGLHEICIVVLKETGLCDQLNRLISPCIRQIRENGTNVVVQRVHCVTDWEENPSEDKVVTHFFDEPSADDYKTFEEITGRGKTHNPNKYEDPMLAWWDWAKEKKDYDLYHSESVNPAFVRVWLQEHFEAYTFYQKNKNLLRELDRIKADVEWQEATTKDIRLKYYNRVVGLVNPELATSSATASRATLNPWG